MITEFSVVHTLAEIAIMGTPKKLYSHERTFRANVADNMISSKVSGEYYLRLVDPFLQMNKRVLSIGSKLQEQEIYKSFPIDSRFIHKLKYIYGWSFPKPLRT